MFLASALKRGSHVPGGGECLSLGHLIRTWPPAILVKTTFLYGFPANVKK
jgi:hypothetical protein